MNLQRRWLTLPFVAALTLAGCTSRHLAPTPAALASPSGSVSATASPTPDAGPGPTVPPQAGTGLRNCPDLPTDNVWHADVTRLPVLAGSAGYVSSIGAGAKVKADFGAGQWDGGPIGIPVTYVPAGQARVPVSFDYADESDKGPYPIPRTALVEGGPSSDGDRHVLVVDTGTCRLYEMWDSHPNPDGSWHAGSGAVFDLRGDALRPAGWTSADAAGLPIVPGLVRYEEVAAGRIDHAIRVTVPHSQNRYLWPARHAASNSSSGSLPPMGLRLRLKSTVDNSRLPSQARVVAQAMKTYGVIVADNGSAWYLSGAPDERWSNDALRALGSLTGNDFEAVDVSGLMAGAGSGKAKGY